MPNPYGPLTDEGQKIEDAAILRRLAREAEVIFSRYTLPRRIERVPEHLRCQAYALDGRDE